MRVGIVANDTRGGVEPYAALAHRLNSRGHNVRLIAPADFAPLVAGSGIEFFGLSGNAQEDMRGASDATHRGPIASMRIVAAELGTRIRTWTQEALDAADGVEVLTGGVGGMVVGLGVADKLGVPFIPAHLQPIDAPTSAYPGVLLPWMRPNVLGHRLTSLALWTPFAKAMADARHDVLGLSGRSTASVGHPSLYAISPSVLTVPGQRNHTTGYWFTAPDLDWRPSPDLERFLEQGPAISIGFGSMAGKNPEATTATVLEAARSARLRVVLLSGWGGLSDAARGEDVIVQDSVPHGWLFPRMSAVVHHGGAGTTAAGLRAGVPNIVAPFTVDQPFWADRVASLGVGPRPIPQRGLTVARLAKALVDVRDSPSFQGRARELGVRIRSEDGLAQAATIYEQL